MGAQKRVVMWDGTAELGLWLGEGRIKPRAEHDVCQVLLIVKARFLFYEKSVMFPSYLLFFPL